MVPCPAGFTIVLVAARFQALLLGLLVLSVFSVGLCLLLVAVGAALVLGQEKLLDRIGSRWKGLVTVLPLISPLLVAAVGVFFVLDTWEHGREPIKALLRAFFRWLEA